MERYAPRAAEDEQALTGPIVELVSRFGRYGYRRITALLRMTGWDVNHKRVEGYGDRPGSRFRRSSRSEDGCGSTTAGAYGFGRRGGTTCGPTTSCNSGRRMGEGCGC